MGRRNRDVVVGASVLRFPESVAHKGAVPAGFLEMLIIDLIFGCPGAPGGPCLGVLCLVGIWAPTPTLGPKRVKRLPGPPIFETFVKSAWPRPPIFETFVKSALPRPPISETFVKSAVWERFRCGVSAIVGRARRFGCGVRVFASSQMPPDATGCHQMLTAGRCWSFPGRYPTQLLLRSWVG